MSAKIGSGSLWKVRAPTLGSMAMANITAQTGVVRLIMLIVLLELHKPRHPDLEEEFNPIISTPAERLLYLPCERKDAKDGFHITSDD
ncbi:MAG: hypothetical protein GX615_01590 [Lentisphaerae bacterium]|nr:hypothetical protein [Lentisphaerota bacterium]